MPFIPHTEEDVRRMLEVIGVQQIDDLFDEIPPTLRAKAMQVVPEGMSEMEVTALMQARARDDGQPACFIGAGAYDHQVPAAVRSLTSPHGHSEPPGCSGCSGFSSCPAAS